MNIFITGSNGYVGNALVKSMETNHNLFLVKSSENYRSEEKTFYLNLSDSSHCEKFCQENLKIDIIIHAASKMASSDTINDISILYDNIKMYENLAIIAHHFNPHKVINFSSMAVYPNIDGVFAETSIINPSKNNDAFYGLSKFCGENILDFKLRNSSIKTVHLRVGQIYSDEMRDDRLYMMMKRELQEYNQISVYGNGERISNFIQLNSLLNIIDFFIKNDSEDIGGVFNVGEDNFSYNEFAQRIIKQFGNDTSKIVFYSVGAKMKFQLDSQKLKRVMEKNV